MIYKPLRKVGKADKLIHRWLGPYSIMRRTTPVNYEVMRADGEGKSDIVHVVRMKKYHTRDEENETTETVTQNEEPEKKDERQEHEKQNKKQRGRPKKKQEAQEVNQPTTRSYEKSH